MKNNGIFNFPETVTWRILSECINNCLYCYGPKNIPQMATADILQVIELFSLRGVKNIVLTGGEPLLLPNFSKIIEKLSEKKIKIILDTSCFNFFKYNFLIDDKISDLGVPFDTTEEKMDYRAKGNFAQRLATMDYYRKHRGKKPLLRIGTVVSKQNVDQLDKIAKFISNFDVTTWKLYQFIPMGENGRQNSDDLLISDGDFLRTAWEIRNRYGGNLNVVVSPKASRSRAYFMLDPDGSVITPESSSKYCFYKKVGSIFDPQIMSKWQIETRDDNYLNNFNKTFKLDNLSLPLNPIQQKILAKSLPYYEKSQSYQLHHIAWMLKHALPIARQLNLDTDILLSTIILHDVGHYNFRNNPYFAETRVGHMKVGKEISKNILDSLNFDNKKLSVISDLVGKHDLWSLGETEVYKSDPIIGVFNDLNFASILEDNCFEENKKYLNLDDEQMVSYASGNTTIKKHSFFNKVTKKLHHQELLNKEFQILSST